MNDNYKSIFKNEICTHMQVRSKELGKETFRHYKHAIEQFDSYLYKKELKDKCISFEILQGWVKEISVGRTSNTTGQYIHYVRQLLFYLISCGHKCFIPHTLRINDIYSPYLYTDDEIEQIFKVADSLKAPHAVKNKWIEAEMPMLLRLLLCCGLRVGEATSITIGDINFQKNVILLKVTKKYKQRLVPYSEELADILYKYCLSMGIISNQTAYIFPGINEDEPLSGNNVRNYFKEILRNAGITREGYLLNQRGPCLHCFRHTFAVKSFDRNERAGMKSKESIPFLSTYLGHDSLHETEKYLKYSGNTFSDTLQKFEVFTQDLFPEVTIDE